MIKKLGMRSSIKDATSFFCNFFASCIDCGGHLRPELHDAGLGSLQIAFDFG